MNKQPRRIILACLIALVSIGLVLVLAGCRQECPVVETQAQGLRARGTQHTFQSAVVTNTNGTAMWVDSYPTIGVQIVGITNATVSFVATIDGSNWEPVEAVNVGTGAKATSTTADGIFRIPNDGLRQLRTPISSWVGGTITVKGNAPAEASYALEDPQLAPNDGVNIGDVTLVDADGDKAEIGPNGSLAVKQLLLHVDECETITSETVAGSTDVSGIAISTQHRGAGTNSIEFDKTGTTEFVAYISRTIEAVNAYDWVRHSFVDYWLWITDADQAAIDTIYIGFGTDINNYWYWETDGSDYNDGDWTHIHLAMDDIDGQVGVGADWSEITFWILYVTLDNSSDTLTNMRIDDIALERTDSVYVQDVHNDGFTQVVNINDASAGSQTNDITVEGVAGEAHLGEIGYAGDWITATMTMAASTYADGDVLADTQEITGAIRVSGGHGFITSIVILDEDDQGGDLDVVFFRSDVSLGTEDSPVSISDADARQIMCTVRILSSDYDDLIASQVAVLSNIGCGVESASDSKSIWVGLISRDTKTYTNGGIQLAVFFDQN